MTKNNVTNLIYIILRIMTNEFKSHLIFIVLLFISQIVFCQKDFKVVAFKVFLWLSGFHIPGLKPPGYNMFHSYGIH